MSEEKPAPYLKVDWNKWCDEDEESANCKFNFLVVIRYTFLRFCDAGIIRHLNGAFNGV